MPSLYLTFIATNSEYCSDKYHFTLHQPFGGVQRSLWFSSSSFSSFFFLSPGYHLKEGHTTI